MISKQQKLKQKYVCVAKKKLPIRISQTDFNKYIRPHLKRRHHGPASKISSYKIFNYILFVLHTGIQWRQLPIQRSEIHWSNVYKWHGRWSKDGSYERLFESSVRILHQKGSLDLSILHGDGTNVIAKKGGSDWDTRDTNIRKVRKRSVSRTIGEISSRPMSSSQ
jgi:transposase